MERPCGSGHGRHTNDARALKEANIGLSMEIQDT